MVLVMKSSNDEEALSSAKEDERRYEWLKAVGYYEKALSFVPESDFLRRGEISESLAFAVYKAAFQAEHSHEFKERMGQALTCYGEAKKLYERSAGTVKVPRISRCDAMIAFAGYWLASEASEKKKLLDECWRLAKGALEVLEGAEASLDYGKTFNMLSISPVLEFILESDFQARVRIMKETVECGEKAIRFLSASDDVSELARACAKTVVCLGMFGYYCQDLRERERSYQKGLNYWQKARELSEEIAIIESLCPVFGCEPMFGLEGSDEAFSNYKKGLEYAKKTRDKFLIGCALDWLTYHTAWKTYGVEDKNETAQLVKTQETSSLKSRSLVHARTLYGSKRLSPNPLGCWH